MGIILGGSILMEQDKYQAIKWKQSYFTKAPPALLLQQSFLEVSNGISNDQIAA